MYLGELSGVPEWQGWGGPISQAAVDARWREIGQKPPAPIVPPELIGLYVLPSRGPRMFSKTPKGKPVKIKDGKAMADFLNFWGKVAVDPYRKQSGISKVAGAVLQVASVAIPAFSYFQAVEAAGNTGLTLSKQGGDEKLAERVMLPAFQAQEAADTVAANKALADQIAALQTFAPTNAAPALNAQIVGATKAAPEKSTGIPPAVLFAAIAGGVLLLGALRR